MKDKYSYTNKHFFKRIISGCILAIFVLTLSGCKSGDYKKANALLENEEFSSAQEIFDTLGDYKDSKDMSAECQYQTAMQYYTDKNYKDAVVLLAGISGYDKATQAIHIIALELINDEYVEELTKTTECFSEYFESESQRFISWVNGGMADDFEFDYSSESFIQFITEESVMNEIAQKIDDVFTAEVLENCDEMVKNVCEKFTEVNEYTNKLFTVNYIVNLLSGSKTGTTVSFEECASLAAELEEALKDLKAS